MFLNQLNKMKPLRGFIPGKLHFSIDMLSLTGKTFYQHANTPEIEWYSVGNMSSPNDKNEIWIPVIKTGLE